MYGPKWMIQYEMPRFLKYTFVPSGPLTPHCFTLWTIIAQSLYLRQLMLKETEMHQGLGAERDALILFSLALTQDIHGRSPKEFQL